MRYTVIGKITRECELCTNPKSKLIFDRRLIINIVRCVDCEPKETKEVNCYVS